MITPSFLITFFLISDAVKLNELFTTTGSLPTLNLANTLQLARNKSNNTEQTLNSDEGNVYNCFFIMIF